MKFHVGDKVRVTAGKDKGVEGEIVAVDAVSHSVVVKDANVYAKHIKPMAGRAGDKIRRERPLSTAKVALLNEKGELDRVGYSVAKDGTKTRIFKKTGKPVPEMKNTEKKKK
ncbi:MAG: 50S ribosomal protein L24 [Microgenomates group bacterium]